MKSFLFIFFFLAFGLFAHDPIIFKENKGQWPDQVLFGADFLNAKFYVNKTGFTYCVYNWEDLMKCHQHGSAESGKTEEDIIHGHNYQVNFIGADFGKADKENALNEYYNYFIGNDRSKWAAKVRAFEIVSFKNIYPQTDLKLYSSDSHLKYDLILKKGAEAADIKLNYDNTNGITIRNNRLIINTSVGEVVEQAPYAYQLIDGKLKTVSCKFKLTENNTIGFEFPNGYDSSEELVIDPVVVVCSYSGSSIKSGSSACTYDDLGNIYSFGYADASYPVSAGAFQSSSGGSFDYMICKYNKTGSSRVFATYLGGDSIESPICIVVKNNRINLMGITTSPDFPCSHNAYDSTANGNYDITLSKLSISGDSLIASTYLGGAKREGYMNLVQGTSYPFSGEIVCDSVGNIYGISNTASSDFPTSIGAFSNTLRGPIDACVFKLNNTLSLLGWSTYLGGTQSENGKGLRLDGSGGVYCLGTTNSNNFPTTPGCYSSTKGGSGTLTDMYVSHVSATGGTLIASTFLGTASQDYAGLIDLNQNREVFVCGNLTSPSFFIPYPGTYSSVSGCNAIYKLSSGLSALSFRANFGSFTSGIDPYLIYTAFKVDTCQSIYLAGYADNSLPLTPNKFQSFGGGLTDIYMAIFDKNCASLNFGSYYGGPKSFNTRGEHVDGGISHFDKRGYLYQAVCITNGLPTTPGAYATTYSNSTTDTIIRNNAFLKVDMGTFVNATSTATASLIGCAPYTFTAVNTSADTSATVYWSFGTGDTTSADTARHTYFGQGDYFIKMVVKDSNKCNSRDSISLQLTLGEPTPFDLGPEQTMCYNKPYYFESHVTAATYSWSSGQNTPNINVTKPGIYQLTIDKGGGCISTDIINFKVGEPEFETVFPNVVTPNNDGVNDVIDLGHYDFSDLDFSLYDRWGHLRFNTTQDNAVFDPSQFDDGVYFYVIKFKSACTHKDKDTKGYISVFR